MIFPALLSIFLFFTLILKAVKPKSEDIMTEEKKNITKGIGKFAGKMLDLTNKGAKKLEDWANKSAEENQNENAKKLAGWMNKLSSNIEEKQEDYVAKVEANADELFKFGKKAMDKTKDVMDEMKQRADVAKEKAEKDAAKKETETAKKKTKTDKDNA